MYLVREYLHQHVKVTMSTSTTKKQLKSKPCVCVCVGNLEMFECFAHVLRFEKKHRNTHTQHFLKPSRTLTGSHSTKLKT